MRSGRIVPRFVLLSSVLTLVLTGSPTLAGTINVLGSVDLMGGSEPFGVINLVGDRGFSSNVVAQFFQFGPERCSGPGCSPGTTISLHAFAGDFFGGGVTLEGVFYPNVDGNLVSPCPCSLLTVNFNGQVVAPPFGQSTTVTLTVPVDFAIEFSHDATGMDRSTEQLVASATATLTLQEFDFGPGFGVGWQYEGIPGIRYDLEPTPEPTTLLLFGTTMVGLGLAAHWRRRRQS